MNDFPFLEPTPEENRVVDLGECMRRAKSMALTAIEMQNVNGREAAAYWLLHNMRRELTRLEELMAPANTK